jgi:hypothetical protein
LRLSAFDGCRVRVEGLKLGALDAAIFAAVKQAFLDHCMLVFPGQYLQPGNPMAFAKMWGEIVVTPMITYSEGWPGLLQLTKSAVQRPPPPRFICSIICCICSGVIRPLPVGMGGMPAGIPGMPAMRLSPGFMSAGHAPLCWATMVTVRSTALPPPAGSRRMVLIRV